MTDTRKGKHTPGPWTSSRMRHSPADKDRRCGFVVNGPEDFDPDGSGLSVRICDLRTRRGYDAFEECEANSRLIAAAPEMAELLRRVADGWIETRHCGDDAGKGTESAGSLARALLARIDEEGA